MSEYVKARLVERQISVRFVLAEPHVIAEGKRINRYSGTTRGYWLPWVVTEVEVSGRYNGTEVPRFTVRGYGHTLTKAGKRGGDYTAGFWSDSKPAWPPEFEELRQQVMAMTENADPWPKGRTI